MQRLHVACHFIFKQETLTVLLECVDLVNVHCILTVLLENIYQILQLHYDAYFDYAYLMQA